MVGIFKWDGGFGRLDNKVRCFDKTMLSVV